MKRKIAVSIASVALCLGGLVVAQAGAATKTVGASGGSVVFSASVRSATTCHWSSSPKIPSFTTTVKCRTGTVARSARFTANTSTTAKSYALTLTVRGKTTMVDHWKVTQAAETPPTTTTVPVYAIGATQNVQDLNKNTLAVTITQLIDPATGAAEYDQPNAGYRFVAVDMNLTNQSAATISDDANNGVHLIGTDNQAYPIDFDSVAECTNFSYGLFTLSPGGTESGCVVFQLPSGVNAKSVQFSLGYGYLDVAQWTVTPSTTTVPPTTTTTTTTTTVPFTCIVGSCTLTFHAPDTYDATNLTIGSVLQNAANPDPIFATPAGDQLDEVTLAMTTGPTGMSDPGEEVSNFALALVGGGQGTVDLLTFDSTTPYAMGALGPVAANSIFTAAIYFDVPIGSNWSSVNFELDFTNVYSFLP